MAGKARLHPSMLGEAYPFAGCAQPSGRGIAPAMTTQPEHPHSQRPVWLGEDKRAWDHVRIHISVVTDPRVTSDMLAVYAGIAVHAEVAGGSAFPSEETLASYAAVSDRTVRRCLAALRLGGWIEVEERRGKSSIYRLLAPPTLDTGSEVPPATPDRGSGVPRTEVPRTPDTGSDELEPSNHNHLNEIVPSSLRPDVSRLCQLLADLIEANGSTRPTIGTTWHDSCRLLIDKDGRTPEQVEACIRWCQTDDFWHRQILSMPKLRAKYDQLRLAAKPRTAGRGDKLAPLRESAARWEREGRMGPPRSGAREITR